MPRKLFISAGHSNNPNKDRGAVGNGYIEGELTVELRKLIVDELKKLSITPIVDSDDTVTKETVIEASKFLDAKDIAIDIHFNASDNPVATGAETVIPATYTNVEYIIANDLLEIISSTLSVRKRRVITENASARGRLAFMRVNCENILLEICFISNKKDMEQYQTKKQDLAKAIANYLIKML